MPEIKVDDITVRVITWNIGKSYSYINDWSSEIERWDIIKPDVDILFITLQEAPRHIHSIRDSIKAKMGPSYTMYHQKHGSIIPFVDFYVHGYLFVRSDLETIESKKIDNTVDSVCINKSWFGVKVCTKPAIGMGIVVSKYDKLHKLIFVGCHLPIDSKDLENENLGYKDRIDAVKIIKEEVIGDIEKALGGYNNVFWTGDLNFRIGTDNAEQLDQLMTSGKVLPGFVEHEREREKFRKTCRYKEYDGTGDYNLFIQNRLTGQGFDSKRRPSYCDRVIYKGLFTVTDYYTWPKNSINYPRSAAYSDHLVVVLEGSIQKEPEKPIQTGGNYKYDEYYKLKYYKYKAKYMKLRESIEL